MSVGLSNGHKLLRLFNQYHFMHVPIDFGSVCIHCLHQTEIDARAELVSVESDLMVTLIVNRVTELLFKFSQNVIESHPDPTFALCGERDDRCRVKGIGIIAGQFKSYRDLR